MREIYKKLSMAALYLLVAMSAAAQTTGYAITTNANNKKCYAFSFDISDPSVVETVWTDTVSGEAAVLATLAGDVYYTYMSTDGASTYDFCSINFTTGVKTLLSKAFPGSNETWYDICYDATTKELYGLRKADVYNADNELESSSYQICTIHQSTGKWTEVITLPAEIVNTASASYYLGAICSDGNGGIDVMGANKWFNGTGNAAFWSSYINLYRVDLTTKETSIIYQNNDATVVKVMYSNIVGAGAKVSMELHDGKIYYVGNNNFLTIDVATGAVTKAAKNFTGEPVGLCFAMSTADGVPAQGGEVEPTPDTRMVKVVETYGDHMGERVGQITHKKVSLYDGENRLQREATYGLSYTNLWEIEYFGTCTYNEAGQLAMTASQKYGIHDGTDLGFIDNNDTITYTYDEAGRLVRETMQAAGYSMAYEYNEAGQKVKEIKLVPDYYNQYEGDEYVMYEITYSAFNAYGQPDSIHSTGMYDNDKYFGAYTYDEQGRKTGAHTWTLADTTDVKVETWTYNDDAANDTVRVYWVHEWFWGFDQGEKRTVYTYDNGNTNRTKEQVQTLAANGAWVNESTYTITELSEMNPEAVATIQCLPISGGFNGVDLFITLPEAAVTGTIAFDVYRHGIKLARLNATDAKDGLLVYPDRGVKNGIYDYYVQTVLINDLLETEEVLNISNIVTYSHYVKLPVVTDLKCTSARLEGGVYYATVEWVAPEPGPAFIQNPTLETFGFQRYNVMLEKMKAADNLETDGQALTWEVNCGYTGKVNLYVQTVYTYGKANSEMISIDCQAVMDAQGIENAEAEAQVTVRDGIVAAVAPARLVAYNAQGAVVAEAVNTLDLNTLPAGIYLVKVETAEGVKTVKVRL